MPTKEIHNLLSKLAWVTEEINEQTEKDAQVILLKDSVSIVANDSQKKYSVVIIRNGQYTKALANAIAELSTMV